MHVGAILVVSKHEKERLLKGSLPICFQVKYECVWESCLQLMGCSLLSPENVFSSNQKSKGIVKKKGPFAFAARVPSQRNNWSSHTFWSPIGISLKLTHVIIDSLETITLHSPFPFGERSQKKKQQKSIFSFLLAPLMHFFSKCYCLFYASQVVRGLLKSITIHGLKRVRCESVIFTRYRLWDNLYDFSNCCDVITISTK